MAEASACDTAGPSSATEAELEQEVRQAEAKFQQGIQAIKVLTIRPPRVVCIYGYHLALDCGLHVLCRFIVNNNTGHVQVNDLDQAVELFGQVLQTRCQQFGGQFTISHCSTAMHCFFVEPCIALQMLTQNVQAHILDMAQLCSTKLRMNRMSLALPCKLQQLMKMQKQLKRSHQARCLCRTCSPADFGLHLQPSLKIPY